MSPEQARSARDVDTTADVWAVGVMLYEALSGRTPFEGRTPSVVVVNVITTPHPPLRSMSPDVPQALARLIDRCLSKEAQERPRDARALLDELRAVRRQLVVPPTVASSIAHHPRAPAAPATSPHGGFGAQPTPTPTPTPTPQGSPAPPTPSPGFGAPPTGSFADPAKPPAPAPRAGGTRGGLSIGCLLGGALGAVMLLAGLGVGGWALYRYAGAESAGQIRLETNVQNGELFVDGSHRGAAADGRVLELPTGAHVLELRMGDRPLVSQNVQVVGGRLQEVVLHSPEQYFEDRLAATDQRLQSGEFADEYTFDWEQGTRIRVEATSNEIDTYLIVFYPAGGQADNDDRRPGDTNSELSFVTAQTGSYRVVVTSYRPGEVGAYTLRVREGG